MLDGYGGGNGTSMVEGFICSSAIIVAKVVVQCKWWFVDDVGNVGELVTMVVMIGWYRLVRKFTGEDLQNLVQVLLALF